MPPAWRLLLLLLSRTGLCPHSEHRFPAPSSKEGCHKPVLGIWALSCLGAITYTKDNKSRRQRGIGWLVVSVRAEDERAEGTLLSHSDLDPVVTSSCAWRVTLTGCVWAGRQQVDRERGAARIPEGPDGAGAGGRAAGLSVCSCTASSF